MNPVRAIVLLLLLAARANAGPIILEGDSWRYYKGNSTPSNNWTQVGFGDSIWGGPAPSGFGYGDGDDATIFADMQNTYASVFLRRTFVIASTTTVTHLSLAADYDDGFVAYINGAEVLRVNMPGGTITHTTLASGGRECSRSTDRISNEKEFFALDPSALVNGTNVLALSGHNASLGSSDFSLVAELYTNVTLVRGPFIQMPDTNGLVVAWRTDALTDSVVDYGPDTNYAAGTVSNGAPTRAHAVCITGLLPGTGYYYRIRSGGVTLREGVQFRTRAAPDQSFRFAVIGDFGASGSGAAAVAARVNATNVDLLLTVGDNIYYNGQPGDYDAFWFSPYAGTLARSALFPIVGNHDVHFGNSRSFTNSFILPSNGPLSYLELNYSYDFGNAHFTVIDSNHCATNDAAAINALKVWVSNDLAATTQTWKFVQIHHPPYTSEGAHPDEITVKTELCPVFEAARVAMVFEGHNHFYERLNPIKGVYYVTDGGGGQGLYPVSSPKDYSASVCDSLQSFVVIDVQGTTMDLRAMDQNGQVVDSFNLDIGHPFRIDGLLDNSAWSRATNNLALFAAIRSNVLYVATQDAGEGNDHFIYLADHQGTSRPAAWFKSGNVMQWGAFLADENDGGYNGWFGADESALTNPATYRSVTSGLNNNSNSANGVLEGTIDLAAHFGAFPPQLYFAIAPYRTTNGGHMLAWSQVPAGDGGPNINPNEFLALDTRALALDLPVADAGANQAVEAGMAAALDGSGSTSPGGFALSSVWARVSGPPALVTNNMFVATSNVGVPTDAVVRLTVNDTRFDSTDTVVITVLPMLDSDADGLSDYEEGTGLDNLLTAANPAGHVTGTNSADSDSDGMTDGDEALAGTNPNASDSVFEFLQGQPSGTDLVITWSSVSGRLYHVDLSTNLLAPRLTLTSDLVATPPINAYTVPVSGAAQEFYLIRTGQ